MLPFIGVAIGVVVFEAAAVLMSTALCAGSHHKPKKHCRHGGGHVATTSATVAGLGWGEGYTGGTGGDGGCSTGQRL